MKYKVVVQKTLAYIQQNNIEATPLKYKEIFCSIANLQGVKLDECYEFEHEFKKLDKSLKHEAEKIGVNDISSLIDFLNLKALEGSSMDEVDSVLKNEIQSYKKLLIKSLTPSFSATILKRVKILAKKLRDPEIKISNDNINSHTDRLISERINGDRTIVFNKLYDFNNIADLLYAKLNKILKQTNMHSQKLAEMRIKINEIKENEDSNAAFALIKEKLITMNNSISKELSSVKGEIEEHKKDVKILKNEIALKDKNSKALNKEADEAIQSEISSISTKEIKKEKIEIEKNERSLFDLAEKSYIEEHKNYSIIYYEIVGTDKIRDKYGQKILDKIIALLKSFIQKELSSSDEVKTSLNGLYIISFMDKVDAKKFADFILESMSHKKFKIRDEKISLNSHTGIASRGEHGNLEEAMRKVRSFDK